MTVSNLPIGWGYCQLGQVLTLVNGRAYKKNEMLDKGTPILRIQNLNGGNNWFYSDLNLSDDKYCEKDDLLYAWSATFGPYWSRWDEKVIYHYHIWKVIPSAYMLKKFAYYEFLRITDSLKASAHGVAMPHITKEGMEKWPLLLPPLAEQQEIVRQLDVMLAQVEQIKARLDAIPAILKKFRQSVLADAVSGKLTEEWREQEKIKPQIKELQDLKDSLIKSKEIKKDLEVIGAETLFEIPENWENLALQSFASKITDGEHSTPKRESAGHYLLSARNVRDGYIDVSNVDYVGIEEFSKLRKRCDPNKGDVLISCSGSVGRIALVDKDDEYVMVRSAALVKTLDSFIDNKFLMYVLQSPYLQKQIDEKSKSTAQSNLFLGQIKELSIPYPSLKEQKEIVQQVESLFKNASLIETAVQSAQKRVNLLTQSILAKAFNGELTAEWREQHQDLVTGVNSAESLLAKIQAEREASKPVKKTRAKKQA